MCYLNKLIILINFLIFCNGCLPNPSIESGPVITIGPMMEVCDPNPCLALSGTLITISSATADLSCVYTATATCDVSNANVEYNGAGPTFPDPQTLTCDTGTSQFTYTDGGGVQQQITSIQCTCNPNPCGAPPTGTGVSTTTPAVDANCVYTSDVVCTPPLMMGIQYNTEFDVYLGPDPITCDDVTMQWTHQDIMSNVVPITTITCVS